MTNYAPPLDFGPVLADVILQCFCQGIILAQLWDYRRHYRDDSHAMKFYVFVLGLATLVQTVFIIYKSFMLLVVTEDNSKLRLMVTTSIDLFINGLICTLCQSYLIRRCWKVTANSPWVLWPLSGLAGAVFIADAFICVASGFGKSVDSKFVFLAVPAILFWIFGTIVLEIIITTILLVYLWRSRTGLPYLDRTLENISRITWSTALVPCVFMSVAAILNRIYAHNPVKHLRLWSIELFFILITGRFYVLGLLLTINSRRKWRDRMKSHDIGRVSLSDWQWGEERTAAASEESVVAEISRRASLASRCTTSEGTTGPSAFTTPDSGLGGARASGCTTESQQQHSPIIIALPPMDARERSLSSRRPHIEMLEC